MGCSVEGIRPNVNTAEERKRQILGIENIYSRASAKIKTIQSMQGLLPLTL